MKDKREKKRFMLQTWPEPQEQRRREKKNIPELYTEPVQTVLPDHAYYTGHLNSRRK